jgi:UDPglucose 6-dehydrogenase
MNISVVGLGKLGLCTAACFAMKGHSVIGVDKNLHSINELLEKRCPIKENNLPETLNKAWTHFTVTSDTAYAIEKTDVTLIITPTPSNKDGRFSNSYIESVLGDIAPVLQKKQGFHVVDVVSTVMPGSCDNVFKPFLERETGKKCGKEFGLVYNPEFIALGSVIRDFLNPDMVLIGASDDLSSGIVEKLYLECCESSPRICKMSLINAEITKISLNCYVTMKISYANQLASICEKVPGADVDVITNAVGADTRVGNKYLKGGLGFAGPCFPRDNFAFQRFAEDFGGKASLGRKVIDINNEVVSRIHKIVSSHIKSPGKAAILGMSYKPGTHITEESQSVLLAGRLLENGYKVCVHDPAALEQVRQHFGEAVDIEEDIYQCITDADAIILMMDWPDYKHLDLEKISRLAHEKAVFLDCWRIYKNINNSKINYIGLGMG